MKVKLRRTLVTGGHRYKPSRAGVEIPDGTSLPRDAEIWDEKAGKWVPSGDATRQKEDQDADESSGKKEEPKSSDSAKSQASSSPKGKSSSVDL